MLSKAQVLNALQSALPQAKLMWEDEEAHMATVIIGLKDTEHYIGLDLSVKVTVEELIRNIQSALEVRIP